METQKQNNLERSETKPQKRLLEESFGEGDPQIPIKLLVGRTGLKELSCLLLSSWPDEGGMLLVVSVVVSRPLVSAGKSLDPSHLGDWFRYGPEPHCHPAGLSNTHFWDLLPQYCADPSCLWDSTGTASGTWSNLSKAALVHMGFLSWENIVILALNNLCWH